LRTQYQDNIDIKRRRNQKVIGNRNDELEVKPSPKTEIEKSIDTPKSNAECQSCGRRSWIEVTRG